MGTTRTWALWTLAVGCLLWAGAPSSTSAGPVVPRDGISDPSPTFVTRVPAEIEAVLQGMEANVTSAGVGGDNVTIVQSALDDPQVQLLLQDPSLTYCQLLSVYSRLSKMVHRQIDSLRLPSNLLTVMPSNKIMDLASDDSKRALLPDLAKRVPRMTPSQRLALFEAFITRTGANGTRTLDKTRVSEIFNASAYPTVGETILMNYVGPVEFADSVSNFDNLMKKKSELKLDVISHLPRSLLRAWFEDVKPDFTKAMHPSISSITCQDLKPFDSFDDLKKVLNNFNALRRRLPSTAFPRSLLGCFRDRVGQHLEELRQLSNSSKPLLDYLAKEDVGKIGGLVLSSFNVSDFQAQLNESVVSAILQEIGSLPMSDIISTLTREKTQQIAELAVAKMGPKTVFQLEDLVKLGSLLHVSSDVLSKANASSVVEFVKDPTFERSIQVVCMTEAARRDWGVALTNAFGDPKTWHDVLALVQIGDLLMALNDSQKESIPFETLFHTLPIILDSSKLYQHFQDALLRPNETQVALVCQSWLKADGENFTLAFGQLQRFYVRVAQLRADVLGQVGTRNLGRSMIGGSRIGFIGMDDVRRISKRQVEEVDTQFKNQINNLLKEREFTYSETTRIKLNLAMERVMADNRAEAVQILGLDPPPPRDKKLGDIISDLQKNGSVLTESVNKIAESQIVAQAKANRQVVTLIGLSHVDFGMSREQFCDYFADVCDLPYYDYLVLKSSPVVASDIQKVFNVSSLLPNELPSSLNCSGLKEAGRAAAILSDVDFRSWQKEDLEDCLETLGAIAWPLETKKKIWRLLKEQQVGQIQGSKIRYENMLALNNILEAVVDEDLSRLSLSPVFGRESLSLIGEMTFSGETLRAVIGAIKAALKVPLQNVSEVDVMTFGSMKNLVCGFDNETLTSLMLQNGSTETARFLLPILGSMKSCSNQAALHVMSKAAQTLYGEPKNWTLSTKIGLGIIAGGSFSQELLSNADCNTVDCNFPASSLARSLDSVKKSSSSGPRQSGNLLFSILMILMVTFAR